MKKAIISCLVAALFVSSFVSNVKADDDFELEWIKGLDNLAYGAESGMFEVKKTSDGNLAYLSIFGTFKIIDQDAEVLIEKNLQDIDDFEGTKYYYSFQQAPDGGFLFGGQHRTGSVGDVESYSFLIKTDGEVNKIWNETYEFPGYNYVQRVLSINNGYALIVGADEYLITIDEEGKAINQYSLENENIFSYIDYKTTNDGGYIILYDGPHENGVPLGICKLNSKCEIIWSKEYTHGQSFAEQRSFDQLNDGGYAIFMNYNKEVGYGSPAIMFIDNSGNKIGVEDLNYLGPVKYGIETNDGGFLLTGGHITDDQNPEYDVFVTKTDKDGNELWNTTFGEETQDTGIYIIDNGNNEYYIIGDGCNSLKEESEGETNLFIAKFSSGSASSTSPNSKNSDTGEGNGSSNTPGFGFLLLIIAFAFIIYLRKNKR